MHITFNQSAWGIQSPLIKTTLALEERITIADFEAKGVALTLTGLAHGTSLPYGSQMLRWSEQPTGLSRCQWQCHLNSAMQCLACHAVPGRALDSCSTVTACSSHPAAKHVGSLAAALALQQQCLIPAQLHDLGDAAADKMTDRAKERGEQEPRHKEDDSQHTQSRQTSAQSATIKVHSQHLATSHRCVTGAQARKLHENSNTTSQVPASQPAVTCHVRSTRLLQ